MRRLQQRRRGSVNVGPLLDPMVALAGATRAGYFATSRLTEGEIEDGWVMCDRPPGVCDRVPDGWVKTIPHAHRTVRP